MEINWLIIALLAVVVVALVAFIISKNRKDKKALETFLDHDLKKEEESEENNEH